MSLLKQIRVITGIHTLISALERTIELLESSKDSDWSNLTADELAETLKKELSKIKNNRDFDKFEIAVLFAPTGNIQETAMRNNWHREYLKISTTIDKYTQEIR